MQQQCLSSDYFNVTGVGLNKCDSIISSSSCSSQMFSADLAIWLNIILLSDLIQLNSLEVVLYLWQLPASLVFTRKRDPYGVVSDPVTFTQGRETSRASTWEADAQLGIAWTYWCVKMTGCLVIAGIHHLTDQEDAAFASVDSSLLL